MSLLLYSNHTEGIDSQEKTAEGRKNLMKKHIFMLQLFGSGEGTGEGSATGGDAGVAYQDGGMNAAEQQVDATPDRETEFENLIKGDYKEQFDNRVKQVIDKRFKKAKEAEDSYNKVQPLIEKLATKYGKDITDIDGILSASDEDDSYYEEAAYDAGMSVEAFKAKVQEQREIDSLRAFKQEQEAREQRAAQFNGWMQQAEMLKAQYPGFDLRAEFENPVTGPQFISMLQANVPVQTAFQAVHFNDLVNQTAVQTAQDVKAKTVQSIRANGMRRKKKTSTHSPRKRYLTSLKGQGEARK